MKQNTVATAEKWTTMARIEVAERVKPEHRDRRGYRRQNA